MAFGTLLKANGEDVKTVQELLRRANRVRNQRRKELRSILLDRQKMVDTLLLLKKGPTTEEPDASTTPPARAAARVKRYRNE